jgi:hypothetical protein
MSDPIVVGGTGGSGTRLVALLLQHAGVFMGEKDRVNYAMDSMPMNRVDVLYVRGEGDIHEEMKIRLAEHYGGRSCVWGFKHTNSYLALPMWHHYFPDMYFVHVIRDGRDMAYAPHGGIHLFGLSPGINPGAKVLMALWASTNQTCANYGEALMEKYYRVKYEDLCRSPVPTIEKMYESLGAEGDIGGARKLVKPSTGMGRGNGKADLKEVEAVGEYALRRFGYL